jgi:hypothetical protein
MLELVLLDGSHRRFLLTEGSELTIGAAAHATVRLNAADVSRQHSLISCVRGRLVVLDLGSTNGTFVNGKRVKEAELQTGDTIRFSSVLAQVLPPSTPPSSASTAVASLTEPTSAATESRSITSDGVPMIMNDSLMWLLTRWSAPDADAVGALAEWLVAHRGLRAAAVVEVVKGEVGVLAANGGVSELLDDRRCVEVVKDGASSGGTMETVEIEFGGLHAFAVRASDAPCLLIIPNAAMPDTGELELFMCLLGVAVRLDRKGTAGKL